MNTERLHPWEALMKRMVWRQLGDISSQRILDFGSGNGVTACHFACSNEVVAIEPSEEALQERWQEHEYQQLIGSTEQLRAMPDESFDMILCHNVLEYVPDREEIIKEFARLLKPGGLLSVVKHNRAGRVMQMVTLLNDFDRAHRLLDGNDGMAFRFGAIRYYEDQDIENWSSDLRVAKTLGMRTFWDLQQNQDIHQDSAWQDKMFDVEMRVSDIDEYKNIAFFHHLLIEKRA